MSILMTQSRFPASKLRQWRHLYGSNKSQNDGGFICPVELSKECILTFGCRKTKAMIKKKKHHHDKHKALKHKYRRVSRFIFVEKTVLLEDGSFARRMCVLGEMKVAYEKPARSLSGFIPSIFSRKRKRNANDESEDSELSVSKKRKLNKPNNQQKPSNTNNSEANHGVVVGSDLFALNSSSESQLDSQHGQIDPHVETDEHVQSNRDDSEQAISSICTATTHHLVNKGSGVAMKDRERDKKKRKDSEGIGKVNIRCAKGNKERKFATELKLNQNEMLQLLNK
eukprot:526183_1